MNDRVVIRDDDYYGGSIYVEDLGRDSGPYPIVRTAITWEAYQGGCVRIELQDERELEKLGRVLIDRWQAIQWARTAYEARTGRA